MNPDSRYRLPDPPLISPPSDRDLPGPPAREGFLPPFARGLRLLSHLVDAVGWMTAEGDAGKAPPDGRTCSRGRPDLRNLLVSLPDAQETLPENVGRRFQERLREECSDRMRWGNAGLISASDGPSFEILDDLDSPALFAAHPKGGGRFQGCLFFLGAGEPEQDSLRRFARNYAALLIGRADPFRWSDS